MSTEGIDLLRDNPRTYGRTASRTPPEPSLFLDFARATALDPRITFSRGSQATLFDFTGTLVYAKHNLLTYSQDFADASWVKTRASITSDTVIAPDGTLTGDKLVENTDNATHVVQKSSFFSVTSGTSYAFSIYAKAAERTRVSLETFRGLNVLIFDLSNGTVVSGSGGSITAVGNGWYRCTGVYSAASTGTDTAYIRPATNAGISYLGDGTSGVYIWGAQFNIANMEGGVTSSLTTYYPTTTAAYYAPRFDYNPSTLQPLGLLIEEARTNLLLQSQNFTTTWGNTGTTDAGNTTIAPDGTLTADTIVEDNAASPHRVSQSVASSGQVTLSVFAKAGVGTRYLTIGVTRATTHYATATFDLAAVSNTQNLTAGYSGASASIVASANGFYRCSLTVTTDTLTDVLIGLAANPTFANGGRGFESYTGDNASSLILWGAQLEAGAFTTSYIPTTTTALTRNADVASMTGTNFSSWYNASEGTLYVEVLRSASITGVSHILGVSDGTTSNRIRMFYNSNTQVRSSIITSGSDQGQPSASVSSGLLVKFASGYQLDNWAIVANGGSAVADTSVTIPSGINSMLIGANAPGGDSILNGTIRRIAYYNTRLTNAQLQALTA